MRVEKTEREKMMSGLLYSASDEELVEMRLAARRLLYVYNNTTPDVPDKRTAILKDMFGKLGDKAEIEPPFHCDYGYNIFAGDRLYMNFGCVILDGNAVHIGGGVLFGPYVQLYTAYHPTDPALRRSGLELASPIVIKDNVWIGGGAIVCGGVSIGENTTIGAGSIVVKDIPPNVLAAGNPCKVIKKL